MPSCAPPALRKWGCGCKGGALPRAVPRSRALFARERGQKREEGGRTFPGGHRRGASLSPCARFWLRRVRGRKGGAKGREGRASKGGKRDIHVLCIAYTYFPLFVLYLLHTNRRRKSMFLDKNKLCL